MEAFLGNDDEIKQVEDEVAQINIASPNKMALLFGKGPAIERSKSDMTSIKNAQIPRNDFNKAMQPEMLGLRQKSLDTKFAAPYQRPK